VLPLLIEHAVHSLRSGAPARAARVEPGEKTLHPLS